MHIFLLLFVHKIFWPLASNRRFLRIQFLNPEKNHRQDGCCHHDWGGGEDIIPFTLYQAKCWAMEHMDGDAYEAEFGEVEE